MSEVIITAEMKENAKCCKQHTCEACRMRSLGSDFSCVEALASLPGVWDGSPDNAIIAMVNFYKEDKVYAKIDGIETVYTRTLPKSIEDEIAEKYSCDTVNAQSTL